jgi:hypothetical protein
MSTRSLRDPDGVFGTDTTQPGHRVWVGPFAGEEFTVPAQQRSQPHDPNVSERSCKVTGERGHDQPVRHFQSGSWELTAQHRDLVAKQDQLDVLRCLTATTHHNQRQQPADDRVDQRELHRIIFAECASPTAIGVFERHRVNLDGERDILGLWIGPSGGEGAKQWRRCSPNCATEA